MSKIDKRIPTDINKRLVSLNYMIFLKTHQLANCLVVFRNLRALKKYEDELPEIEWDVKDDPSGRLSFIYTSWWVLTSDRELNILFQFALNITNPTKFGIPNKDEVNPAAVFPGNLSQLLGLRQQCPIDLDYENDKEE